MHWTLCKTNWQNIKKNINNETNHIFFNIKTAQMHVLRMNYF